MGEFQHVPVLPSEIRELLPLQPGDQIIDGTVGGGGHAALLLPQTQPGGRLLGIDADSEALVAAYTRLTATHDPDTIVLVQGHNENLTTIARTHGFTAVAAIVLDLGVSSYQLDTAERGFAFSADGPLDMRLDPTRGPTAADLLATLEERQLADLIYHYGEERAARKIARWIVEQREQQPITRTGELAALVARALGKGGKGGKGGRGQRIHPATRTFQALRIVVNRELEQLEHVLPQAVELLRPGGRLAVISFHSLEDRIVKQFFRAESGYRGNEHIPGPERLKIITRKPRTASEAEMATNPRSRSAKLRVAERIAEQDAEGAA